MKSLCLFLGSSSGDPIYSEKVAELGKKLAQDQLEVIYGGGNVGLMGELARSVTENGGKVTGVIPKKFYDNVPHIELNDLHIVETMHERKNKMYELADGFIALPGGIGTLEELAEVLTWQQVGFHQKPVGLYNINGFYEPFRDLLSHMVSSGFLSEEFFSTLIIEDDVDILLEKLEDFDYKQTKWKE
ncbi:TIGR00730 family Rossman fold protein [Desertibacillus haloalkaliphilus]|uniref:LOG family protein n=1 Tax=Desertibacillus haloalkaliphilus TaxID=1328930 RepID=UPI001C26CA3F|nr:TIGR00730 family Rossman fold protein [Desertibacillus haloalkaliphilus]MBU8906207.1 TIGR00730 family Rossman fold protein [Desertibacillus haloalkaliphilus]